MKTIFIPDYRDGNSYQTDLSCHLSNQGVCVYFGLKSIIGKRVPDVLHVHWTSPYMLANNKLLTIIKSTMFICLLVLLKLFGTKIVWTVHNILDHEKRLSSLELSFSKILAKLCNKIIVHCQFAKVEFENVYGKDLPIVVIPHGSYIGRYENKITTQDARDKLGLNREDVVFLHFGYIRSYKGVPELIDTFKRLDNDNAKMFIVGRPRSEDIAEDILDSCKDEPRIRNILKFVRDEDVQIYMNATDVVVLPYKDVLTSGSAILSMSFGKPVIAPNTGCIADTLDDEGNFLYSKTEEDSLFKTIRRALNTDQKVLADMGKHNLQLAKKLSWDDVAEKTHDVYISCMKK
jgi:beta-1,4-mannosyltransferase